MDRNYYKKYYDDELDSERKSILPKVAVGAALGGMLLLRKNNKALTKLAKKDYRAAEKASKLDAAAREAEKFSRHYHRTIGPHSGIWWKGRDKWHAATARAYRDAANSAQAVADKHHALHQTLSNNISSTAVPRTLLYMGAGGGTAAMLAARSERKRRQKQDEERYIPQNNDED